MSVNMPSVPVDDLRDRTVDLLEEGVSAATEAVAPIAERVAKEAGGLLDELDLGDKDTDRRALVALALLAVGLALVLIVAARRRRARDGDREDQD